MKDEIKETINILYEFATNINSDYIYDAQGFDYPLISDCIEELLDYITNLQEENKRLKELCDKYEEEHNTTFKLWKGKLKETMDETLIQKQHDRIKELEAINEEHRKLNGELREENGVSLEKASDKTMILTQKFVIEQLKTRIDKAVDLIIEKIDYDDEYSGYMQMLEVDYNDLLNILQGKSDE